MSGRARLAGLMALVLGMLAGGALPAATSWAQTLTQQALSAGFLARLPPNVSLALGLAKPDEGTEVRQLLSKYGRRIRTFNVGVANHGELVIFNVDAQSGATVAYRLTPEGTLRQAVSYQAGGQVRPLATADAKSGFSAEVRYWSARARKLRAPVPAAPATPPLGRQRGTADQTREPRAGGPAGWPVLNYVLRKRQDR